MTINRAFKITITPRSAALCWLLCTTQFSFAAKDSRQASIIEVEKAPLLTQIFDLPVKYVLQPTFKVALSPVLPPLNYVEKYDVIDRGMDVFTFGARQEVIAFPIISLFNKNASTLGVRYIHKSPFNRRTDRFAASVRPYLDGDFQFASDYSLQVTQQPTKLNFRYIQNLLRDRSLYTPSLSPDSNAGQSIVVADSSRFLELGYEFPITHFSSISTSLGYQSAHYITPPSLRSDSTNQPFWRDLYKRGLYSASENYPISLTLAHNSLESPSASTTGESWNLKYERGISNDWNDWNVISGRWQIYRLLGNRTYQITKAEDRIRRRNLMKFQLDEALPFTSFTDWRQALLERRVLIQYGGFRTVWTDEGSIPYHVLSRLGGNTMLQGYPSGRFVSQNNLFTGFEYRWPLIDKVDGSLFQEFGTHFDDPRAKWQLNNSWGIGLRIRNPDFYFLRMQLIMHGVNGLTMLWTTTPEFE
jgi:hypothetical protein